MFACCFSNCLKWTIFISSLILFSLGLILALSWQVIFQKILNYEISLSSSKTKSFEMWQNTPIPIYLEFYLFNWTNSDDANKQIKPNFIELGPYTFYEHHLRENITFNNNDTITFMTRKTWKFLPEKSNGTLDDLVTVLNPIAIIVSDLVKDEPIIVRKAVDFFLKEKSEGIAIQKSIRELLFDGYDDKLLDIAKKLNISNLTIPFKKFGWFVNRNNSAIYDGVFNMYSGGKDINKLGIITQWNYQHQTDFFPGECGIVNGTSGEIWYPPNNNTNIVYIFSSDLCSNIKLHLTGTDSLDGIEGNLYQGTIDLFDNGTYDSDSKCFATNMPNGVRSISKCKFGAPAYLSLPHFYLADPVYRENVNGMKPNPDQHTTKVVLEPRMGLPLKVAATFQLNLLMRQIKGIEIFSNVSTTMMPCLWFVQKANLSSELANSTKDILQTSKLGIPIGYALLGIGCLLFFIALILFKRKHAVESKDDNEQLLNR